MEKTYNLHGHLLHVSFQEKLVRISRPSALLQFLSKDIQPRSSTFVALIKADYVDLFGKELKISSNSIVVEIWAHVFAGFLARALKKLIKLKVIHKTSDFIIARSNIIDCGERNVDSNRLIWDLLAPFLRPIRFFIPQKK